MKVSKSLMKSIGIVILKLIGVLACLYFFLVSLDIMGSSFSVLTGSKAGSFFTFAENPIAGLVVGILVTCLLQSSSTTTSIIVTMVGSGVLPPRDATYLVFGANIGTSVTNTIVSLSFIKNRELVRRGFAGATVHDLFNYMNVLVWLPLEWIVQSITGTFGPLGLLAQKITESFTGCDKTVSSCQSWESPFKTITGAFADLIIEKNKGAITDVSQGIPSVDLCPIFCDDISGCAPYKFNDKRCTTFSLVSDDNGNCHAGKTSVNAKFDICMNSTVANQEMLEGAVEHFNAAKFNIGGFMYNAWGWQVPAGAVALVFSLIALITCLVIMVKLLDSLLIGKANKITKKILNMPGPIAILFGCALTMLVQSSSITTSLLTPLVAMGTIELEAMFPLTMGANIGTTLTGILAALVGDSEAGFQTALVHVFFNVFGVVLFYPVPQIRKLPINGAKKLGVWAYRYRLFPIVYILIVFFGWPLSLLGFSIGFSSTSTGAIVGASLGLVAFLGLHIGLFVWYKFMNGKKFMESRFGYLKDPEGWSESEDKDDMEYPASLKDDSESSVDEKQNSSV